MSAEEQIDWKDVIINPDIYEKRVALVTGGTRGIGLAIANALAAAGIKVFSVSRSSKSLFTPPHKSVARDLSVYEERGRMMARVIDEYGRIDILVNNAGSQYFSPANKYPTQTWGEQLELMLSAPFDLCQQAYPHMKDNGGHIVNILSTAAFQGARNIVGYVAAKHGLLGLTRALAVEWAPKIHVNAVAPGLTDTDMVEDMTPERRALLESITPSGRFGRPEEVADAVMWLINTTNVYGHTVMVDGGWLAKNG